METGSNLLDSPQQAESIDSVGNLWEEVWFCGYSKKEGFTAKVYCEQHQETKPFWTWCQGILKPKTRRVRANNNNKRKLVTMWPTWNCMTPVSRTKQRIHTSTRAIQFETEREQNRVIYSYYHESSSIIQSLWASSWCVWFAFYSVDHYDAKAMQQIMNSDSGCCISPEERGQSWMSNT